MQTVQIAIPRESPRLRYVLDWIFVERLGVQPEFLLTDSEDSDAEVPIAYGDHPNAHIRIPDSAVLYGTSTYVCDPQEWVLPDKDSDFTFDLFAAVFFLLSRMEEWESNVEDEHGRYLHTESALYKAGLLQQPVVDEWVEALRCLLERRLQRAFPRKPFAYTPTYDIDMAWAYRYKGMLQNTGAALRDFFTGRFRSAAQRLSVAILKRGEDPFDSFSRLENLHAESNHRPHWFVLAAAHTSRFDKNAPPRLPPMRRLIARLGRIGGTGMHPSYYSEKEESRFLEEKTALEELSSTEISASRQHFLRFTIRYTPRFLLHHGITDDYTLGYAGAIGFRAGTGSSFLWYDLDSEKVMPLRLHPFAFMDSAAHYYGKLSAEEAFGQLKEMAGRLEKTGSTLHTVFHNYSLGTDRRWAGWWEEYRDFVLGKKGSAPA